MINSGLKRIKIDSSKSNMDRVNPDIITQDWNVLFTIESIISS